MKKKKKKKINKIFLMRIYNKIKTKIKYKMMIQTVIRLTIILYLLYQYIKDSIVRMDIIMPIFVLNLMKIIGLNSMINLCHPQVRKKFLNSALAIKQYINNTIQIKMSSQKKILKIFQRLIYLFILKRLTKIKF